MLDYYIAKIKNSLLIRLQYPANLLIWALAGIMQPLILLMVWKTVSESTGGAVGGLSLGDFSAYFIVVLLVENLTFTWIFWEFEYRIRGGSFSPLLLRPIHPIHGDVGDNIAYKLTSTLALLPTCGILALLFPPNWQRVDGRGLLLFLGALVLAAVLRFLLEWTLALAAFWLVRVTAVNQLYRAATFVLSGQLAPLLLFPASIRLLAQVLPFRYYVSFPVELLLGHLTGPEILTGFAGQLIWLGMAYLLFRLLWRASMRRHTAVGA